MSPKITLIAALAAAALAATAPAHASPVLQLQLAESGYAARTITGTAGLVHFNGSYGSFSYINGAGVGAPHGTAPTLIDLNSLEVASETGGTVTISLTETGLTSLADVSGNPFLTSLGGTITGVSILTDETYIDTTDTAFGTQQLLADLSYSSSQFSGSSTDRANLLAGTFSETEVFTIQAGANSETSFDGNVSDVPEPGSLALLGAGLVGFGCAIRRRGQG